MDSVQTMGRTHVRVGWEKMCLTLLLLHYISLLRLHLFTVGIYFSNSLRGHVRGTIQPHCEIANWPLVSLVCCEDETMAVRAVLTNKMRFWKSNRSRIFTNSCRVSFEISVAGAVLLTFTSEEENWHWGGNKMHNNMRVCVCYEPCQRVRAWILCCSTGSCCTKVSVCLFVLFFLFLFFFHVNFRPIRGDRFLCTDFTTSTSW